MTARSELTNLLPPERQAVLARDYYLRLGVIAALLVTTLTLIATVLLLPTYVFLIQSEGAKQARLMSVESTLTSAGEAALSARISALMTDAKVLTMLAGAPSTSATIRNVLDIPHAGIAVSGITYTAPAGKNAGTVAVIGSAETRNALRDYQSALQSAPFAASAALPVSAYAKDTDITFTITVTLRQP